jgi:hypothetical protein
VAMELVPEFTVVAQLGEPLIAEHEVCRVT